MERRVDQVAIVGLGQGGTAILNMLLKIPGIQVKYAFDNDKNALGVESAKSHGIQCRTDGTFDELKNDSEVDLIFEVTGKKEIFDVLKKVKHPSTSVLTASAAKIIFHLLDTQRRASDRLEELKRTLETRIIERTEEIERANSSLEQKIVEYEELNQKLLQLNEEKTRYLLHATHQLKAPFAAIQSYVDIIMEGYTGEISAQTHEIMGKIKTRCEVLSNAIKDMLELANIKSTAREKLETTPECMCEILEEVSRPLKVLAEKRNVEIVKEWDVKDCKVRCNRGQLYMLFGVLIENAIHYSATGSKIRLRVNRTEGSHLAISVKDDGIGIKEDHLNRIFDEYFRSNEAVKKNENGSGLGLSIAKEIAKIHNFHLEVRSRVGKGTTFTLTVPILIENEGTTA